MLLVTDNHKQERSNSFKKMNCQWLDYDIKECGSRPIAENRQHSTKLLTPLDTHTHMWGHTHTHTPNLQHCKCCSAHCKDQYHKWTRFNRLRIACGSVWGLQHLTYSEVGNNLEVPLAQTIFPPSLDRQHRLFLVYTGHWWLSAGQKMRLCRCFLWSHTSAGRPFSCCHWRCYWRCSHYCGQTLITLNAPVL